MRADLSVTISEKTHTYSFQVPLYIATPGHNGYMLMIELAGPTAAIRAAWSHIVKDRAAGEVHNTGITVHFPGGSETVRVTGKVKYQRFEEDKNIILVHPYMTKKNRLSFLGGDMTTPSPFFMDAMRRNVQKVPVLKEWAPELWERGINAGCVVPMKVHGADVNCWGLANNDKWPDLVKEMVLSWHS